MRKKIINFCGAEIMGEEFNLDITPSTTQLILKNASKEVLLSILEEQEQNENYEMAQKIKDTLTLRYGEK